jgi:hypothetical protein
MASLVLGAAGSFVGSFFGPLGASLGWSIGSMLGNLINPQKTEGPRLTDLKLQGSQYGQMIPILYGTIRVAGNVIWQTDLVEHSETSDGKGGPEVTTYSYTASFAVLLCEGPIVAVTRIWADGRLIHDATSYASETSLDFTPYLGTEEQLPDPRMEAELGAGNVPAHRGYAYVVFEDLPLGDYGNRIPNLTFEVTTIAPVDDALHLVARNSGLEIEWTHDDGGQGDGVPYITAWDGREDGKIVVRNLAGQSHDYNGDDLTYSGPTTYPGTGGAPDLYLMRSDGTTLHARYAYCGQLLVEDAPIDVYCNPFYAVLAGTTNPALSTEPLYTPDDVNTVGASELAESAGVPMGEFINGVIMTQDRTTMFLFTSPLASPIEIDTWYKIIDGAVVASGTVSPTFNGMMGFAARSSDPFTWNAWQAENNGEWFWRLRGTDGGVETWHIDDAGNFAYNATGGEIGFLTGSQTFLNVALHVIKDGYCGVLGADELAVVSRFPVYAAEGPPLDDVVEDLSIRAGLDASDVDVTELADDTVDGYVISQQGPVRSAVAQLQAAYFFDAVESDLQVKFVKRGHESVITIPDDDLAAIDWGNADAPPLFDHTRRQEEELPRRVNVNFIDREADYQQGTQYAERQVTTSELVQTVGLAIAMTAARAKQIAEVLIYDEWMGRDTYQIAVPRSYAWLEPTDVITANGIELRITKKDESPTGVIKLETKPQNAKLWLAGPAGAAWLGFSQTVAAPKQATDLMLLDVPLLEVGDEESAFYYAMAGARSPRWRGAGLFKSTDGGTNYSQLLTENRRSTIGSATTALGDFHGGNVFDAQNVVRVELTAGSGDLESATEAQVLSGANRAIIGSEVIAFKTATLVRDRVYDLSGLLRGLRGTEWAMPMHIALERFVLLPVYEATIAASEIGITRHYKAVTLGNSVEESDEHAFRYDAVRLKPFAPVHVGGGTDASGNVTVNWTRRSRTAAGGLNGATPLGEESEEYVLQVWDSAYALCARVISGITDETYTYTSAMQIADFGANQATIFVTVGQVGSYELGYQTRAAIPGAGGSNTAPINPTDPYEPPETPESTGSVDDNHMDNFRTLFVAGGRDRQLAYRYTLLSQLQSINWYQRKQNDILADPLIFDGDEWARNLWVNDSFYSDPNTPSETAMLAALANDAES